METKDIGHIGAHSVKKCNRGSSFLHYAIFLDHLQALLRLATSNTEVSNIAEPTNGALPSMLQKKRCSPTLQSAEEIS